MSKHRPTLFQQLQEESAKSESGSRQWRRSRTLRLSILVLSPLLCALFFPGILSGLLHTASMVSLSAGQMWQNETVTAQSSFSIHKAEAEYRAQVDSARRNAAFVFLSVTRPQQAVEKTVDQLLADAGLSSPTPVLKTRLYTVCQQLSRQDFINLSKSKCPGSAILILRENTILESRNVKDVVDSSGVQASIEAALHDELSPRDLSSLVESVFRLLLPTLEFSEQRTNQLREAAADNVPHSLGIVRKGEVIVRHGDILDTEGIAKLNSYGVIRDDNSTQLQTIGNVLGALLHALLIYALFALFAYYLRKRIMFDNLKLASLSALVVLSAAMSWLSVRMPESSNAEYLVLIPAIAMIAAIYFDSRTGFIITVTCSLMFAAVRSNDLNGAFALLFSGTLGAYSVRDLRSRTQLFRSIAFIEIGFVSVLLATWLERNIEISSHWITLLAVSINAVLSPLLTFAVIAVSEKFFGVLTDLALREYDNVNHPLLLEMSEKAPGTYQHTLAIANLVEAAAYAIEASPLLARVGAYFHDIGKIPKAEYFIENQIELANKHDLLSPKKSATIIRNHVQDGLELAREYGLPRRIAVFIPMHHGTGLIKHFYAKALEEQESDSTAELQEENYRYPGPKPNSKETALVMLADGVEAISRTTDDREELEQKIDAIFKDKILDGQLDECNLTMKELVIIREVFARNLVGAHHQRIQYKEFRHDNESER